LRGGAGNASTASTPTTLYAIEDTLIILGTTNTSHNIHNLKFENITFNGNDTAKVMFYSVSR